MLSTIPLEFNNYSNYQRVPSIIVERVDIYPRPPILFIETILDSALRPGERGNPTATIPTLVMKLTDCGTDLPCLLKIRCLGMERLVMLAL